MDGREPGPSVAAWRRVLSELLAAVRAMDPGDLLLFTDWREDPDERLDGPGTEVSRVLAEAAGRGVIVRGLLWRSHLDRFRFSLQEHRDLGKAIVAAGGECLLDMRVRTRGSHHQKLVVLRHHGHPERDVAYVGGIDLCHGLSEPQVRAALGSRPGRPLLSARTRLAEGPDRQSGRLDC